jgi:hypothetical protein
LPEKDERDAEPKKLQRKNSSSALFLIEGGKKSAEVETKQLEKTRKLLVEVESWRPFSRALRIEDRRLLNRMLEKIWSFDDAVENSKEGYETEAFLLGLLILQQKTIDQLEEMIVERKKSGA